MIATLLITVIVEAAVIIPYAAWHKKPVRPLVYTSLIGNLATQSMLWIVLTFAFRAYVPTLIIAEIFIWGLETLFLYAVPANQLRLPEAALLSLAMNLTSLALGWFLPV